MLVCIAIHLINEIKNTFMLSIKQNSGHINMQYYFQ